MRVIFLALFLFLSTAAFAAPQKQGENGNFDELRKTSPPALAAQNHQHAAQISGAEESNVDFFWRRADEAFEKGDYQRAIGLHKAIVALDPAEIESYGVAAWLLWSLGKGDEAVALIQLGVAKNPENAEMWNEAGQHFDLQKKFADSKNAYLSAVKFHPKTEDSQMLRRRLAHAAEKSGDLNLSLETWQGLVRDFPDEAVNKNNLARVQNIVVPAIVKSSLLNLKHLRFGPNTGF